MLELAERGAGPECFERIVDEQLLHLHQLDVCRFTLADRDRDDALLPIAALGAPRNIAWSVCQDERGRFRGRQWENGDVNLVATVGIAMIAVMLAVTALAGRLGHGSRRASLSA